MISVFTKRSLIYWANQAKHKVVVRMYDDLIVGSSGIVAQADKPIKSLTSLNPYALPNP